MHTVGRANLSRPAPGCWPSQLMLMHIQVNFHTTLSGDAMISLLYHRKLEDSWREAADKLRHRLAKDCPAFKGALPGIMGRSRGAKTVLGEEHVTEQLTVADGRTFFYRQSLIMCMPGAANSVSRRSSMCMSQLHVLICAGHECFLPLGFPTHTVQQL